MLFAKHKVRNLCRSTTQWSLSSISHDGRHLCTTKDQSQCWGDFPGGSDGNSCCLQCRRPWFNPWAGKIPWRRKWLPTPVLLPGKSHGRRSLVGYSPWGRKESDMTEQLHFYFSGNPDSCWCLTGSNFALVWLSFWHTASQEAYRWLQTLPILQGKFEQSLRFYSWWSMNWHHTGFCWEGTLQIPWKGS